MSEITELNRKPDIDGDVISAVSVGADSATVGSLEAVDADIGQLTAALNANSQDVSNVGNLDAASLEADGSLSGPTASEGDVVTVPDNPDVVPIYFDAQTGEPLYPDLEETV